MNEKIRKLFLFRGQPRLYLAGKVRKESKRWGVVSPWTIDCAKDYSGPKTAWVESKDGTFQFVNCGPFALMATGVDPHGPCQHGSCERQNRDHDDPGQNRIETHSRSLSGIQACDILIACLDSDDAFGTLVEIGYARALGKPIIVILSPEVADREAMWFASMCAVSVFVSDDPGRKLFELFCEASKCRFAGFNSYAEYLSSDHWKRVRSEARERAGNKCQLCSSTSKLNVHHNNYERLGRELPADVVVLCEKHHAQFHGKDAH